MNRIEPRSIASIGYRPMHARRRRVPWSTIVLRLATWGLIGMGTLAIWGLALVGLGRVTSWW